MTNWKKISSAPRDGEVYDDGTWYSDDGKYWQPMPPKDKVWDSFGKWKGDDCDECLKFAKDEINNNTNEVDK